jgi:bacteriocin-like protein
MATGNQPGTSTQDTPIFSPGRLVKTRENVSPELTEDELKNVSGGLRRASGGGSISSGTAASSGMTFLRFD